MNINLPRNVRLVSVDHGGVLLDTRRGRYWHLNESGAAALRQLLDGVPEVLVAEGLAQDTEASESQALADLTGLVTALKKARLVVVS